MNILKHDMKKSILSKKETATIKDLIRKNWPSGAQNLEKEKEIVCPVCKSTKVYKHKNVKEFVGFAVMRGRRGKKEVKN